MLRCLIALSLFLIAQGAIGQSYRNGFVRLAGGEEIRGLIGDVVEGPSSGIQFKAELGAELRIYYADAIEGYGLTNGKFYTSFRDLGDGASWDFVEVLVTGELKLIAKNGLFYIVTQEGNKVFMLEPTERKFQGVLKKLMKNCPSVAARSDKVKLNAQEISAHVQEFNQCLSGRSTNYNGAVRAVSIAVMAGYDNTQGTFNNRSDPSTRFLASEKLYDRSFAEIGADVTLRARRITHIFGLYTGAYVTTNTYRAITAVNYKGPQGPQTEINEYAMEHTELKIPLGIEFSPLSKSRIISLLRAGVVIPRVMGFESSHPSQELVYTDGSVVYQEPYNISDLSKGIQWNVSAGLDCRLYKMSRLRFKIGYAAGRGTVDVKSESVAKSTKGSFSSVSIMTGFVF